MSLATGVWTIGDCHGCANTLKALVEQIRKESQDEIVFCGDLVDRGPRSREVVQFVIENGFKCVKGNHEDMMVSDIMKTTEYPGNWEMNGGRETLASYEGHPAQLMTHITWMNNLPLFLEFRNCKRIAPEDTDMGRERYLVVSHSAIGKVWDWTEKMRQRKQKTFAQVIMWERYMLEDRHDIYNVFGHTPQDNVPRIKSFYANVDTGACFKRVHYGRLTALHYPSMKVLQQENID